MSCITFNRLKMAFAMLVFIGLVLVCLYGGKKAFEKVRRNRYPPINYTVFKQSDFKSCSPKDLVWGSPCTPTNKTEEMDGCECSNFNMLCDINKNKTGGYICQCKKQEVFRHKLHRLRRYGNNTCKVAHHGLCRDKSDCEHPKYVCDQSHKLYLKHPENMRNQRFCLKRREAKGKLKSDAPIRIPTSVINTLFVASTLLLANGM